MQQFNMEERRGGGRWYNHCRSIQGKARSTVFSIPSPLLAYIYVFVVSAVSRWILIRFKEASPVLSPPLHTSLPPSLSHSPPYFLRAGDPRGLGALRRARRSDSLRPRWPPIRRTALTRLPAPASSSPSEGRTPRACSWNTALFYNFLQKGET